jgi:hypothetical protein
MHLPSGGKPPATDDELLRVFRDSEFDNDSVSEVVNLLPLALAWDKFYQIIITMQSLVSVHICNYSNICCIQIINHKSNDENPKYTIINRKL